MVCLVGFEGEGLKGLRGEIVRRSCVGICISQRRDCG